MGGVVVLSDISVLDGSIDVFEDSRAPVAGGSGSRLR